MTKQQTLICDILANVHDHLNAEQIYFLHLRHIMHSVITAINSLVVGIHPVSYAPNSSFSMLILPVSHVLRMAKRMHRSTAALVTPYFSVTRG